MSINFLPLGEDGWVYKVVDENEKKWFLKLKSKFNKASIVLPSYLKNTLNYDFIPETLKTNDGDYTAEIDGLSMIVQQYLDGQELRENVTDEFRVQVGKNLKKLFDSVASVPQSIIDLLPQETFNRHLEMAEEVIQIASTNNRENTIEKELGEFIKSQDEKVSLIIKRTKELGEKLRQQNLQFGICHADIHTSNILVNKEDKLYFIDWESVMLAPRERDLVFYSEGLGINKNILDGYDTSYSWNKELLIYYKYEWVVQEIADYGKQVFFSHCSEKQKEYALEKFVELFNPNDVVEDALSVSL
jgi:spectinomycin phosphotransferase